MMSAKRNTIFNLVGAGIPLIVAIPAVPLFLQLIGTERYGILAVSWILVGYFAFFDFGMGKAVTQRIAHTPNSANKVGWIGLVLSFCLGIFGAILIISLGKPLIQSFKLNSGIQLETIQSLPWLGLAVLALTLTAVLQGTLEARQRFLASNLVGITTNVLLQALPLAVAWFFGSHLTYILAATALARVISLSLAIYFNFDLLKRYVSFTWLESRELLQFGGWVTVTGIVGPLLAVADQVFIGILLGVTELAHYNIVYNVITRALIISSATMRALFPRFAQEDLEAAKKTRTMALSTIMTIMTVTVVVSGLLLKPSFTLWLGSDTAAHIIPVGLLLLYAVWFNALAFVPFNWLQAKGTPEIPARFHVLELILCTGLLWVLLPGLGVVGAAIVWLIRAILDTGLMFWAIQESQLFIYRILPVAFLIGTTLALAFYPPLFPLQIVITIFVCWVSYQQTSGILKRVFHQKT